MLNINANLTMTMRNNVWTLYENLLKFYPITINDRYIVWSNQRNVYRCYVCRLYDLGTIQCLYKAF